MNAVLKSVPRAPGAFPLLGHVWPLWRDPLAFVKNLRAVGELVRVDLGTMPVYFVTSASLAHEVLVRKGRSFEKGRLYDRLRPALGTGLATAPVDVHRRHRRLMQPMFHHAKVARYGEIMSEHARALVDSLEPGRTIPVLEVVSEYATGTLMATMFSSAADTGGRAAQVVLRNMPVILKYMLLRAVSPKALDRLPIPANRDFDAATGEMRSVIDQVISTARAQEEYDEPDLLSMLLAARDADTGESLTDEEVRDELVTIFLAGAETVATILSWAFHEIAHDREVEERLLAEIDTVVGDRPVTFEDVGRLEYTRRVIDETMRLHAVTMIMRRSMESVEIGGVEVPPGTEFAISLYAVHRDPAVYPDPGRFDPDRWLPEQRRDLPREAYFPFGAGSRKCIGDGVALAEMVITLATVLRSRRLRPVPGKGPREAVSAMPHPVGLSMEVELRAAPVRA
ncbi:cytochrome P450 [Streptomyces sp. NBC_01262]|uniref:cytochrome P450 n=1 Tax=Streptomyces sp. NBC_01262 TaxID=2903803 RepID=UPI002E34C372|nr:cytochrome P450 [Streptomyces sp. NBC_01262]